MIARVEAVMQGREAIICECVAHFPWGQVHPSPGKVKCRGAEERRKEKKISTSFHLISYIQINANKSYNLAQ